jgi:hypothetical protein
MGTLISPNPPEIYPEGTLWSYIIFLTGETFYWKWIAEVIE